MGLTTGSNFDSGLDLFHGWTDNVDELTAGRLNAISAALLAVEVYLQRRFGVGATSGIKVDASGNIYVLTKLATLEPYSRTLTWRGVQPYSDGSVSHFYLTVPFTNHRATNVPTVNLSALSVKQNDSVVSGWSAAVLSKDDGRATLDISKTGGSVDVSTGGYEVTLTLAVS